jgi:hypothetical protein
LSVYVCGRDGSRLALGLIGPAVVLTVVSIWGFNISYVTQMLSRYCWMDDITDRYMAGRLDFGDVHVARVFCEPNLAWLRGGAEALITSF